MSVKLGDDPYELFFCPTKNIIHTQILACAVPEVLHETDFSYKHHSVIVNNEKK